MVTHDKHEHVIYMSRRTAELLWRVFFDAPPVMDGRDLYAFGRAEVLWDDRLDFGIVEVKPSKG